MNFDEFFTQSENDTLTPIRYSMTTDVFGTNRFLGIKRRPIYSPWPNLNSYVAAVIWKAKETGHKELKCGNEKARLYKNAWKPSATYDMQAVIDDHGQKNKSLQSCQRRIGHQRKTNMKIKSR
jgi:hypothetical protein